VVPRLQQAAHERRIRLEVDALDRRTRREARALDDDELEALGQRTLLTPRRRAAEDAAVDEYEALHGPDTTCVTNIVRFGSR
jgi:hypothetical protein